jgi:hypothetical protein
MNIRYLLCAAVMLLTFGATAQLNSDDPSFYNTGTAISKPITSNSETKILTATADTACANTGATIIATGECGYAWSSDAAGLNSIYGTDTLFSGPLTSDTVFYAASTTPVVGSDTAGVPLPPHGSNFGGNIRGYYFQAPVDMKITKLRVPTDASTGDQQVAVLNFGTGPPPLWSLTTNAFAEKGYWPNFTADATGNDTIYTCIDVYAGQYVGIYGSRADVNSYATSPFASTIAGVPTTLYRTGMQLPLSSNPMGNVFAETGGSISRTEFWYTTQFDTTSYVAVPVTVIPSYEFMTNLDVCTGDSALIAGNYYFSDTTITDSLTTMVSGCDSLYTTILTIHAAQSSSDSLWICQGDSALIGGSYYSTAGVVVDSATNAIGCDSMFTVTVFVNALPVVTLAPFTQDTICIQWGTMPLPLGTPAGGTYSGTGVSGTDFDASISGVGTFTVSYIYTDSTGCPNTATTNMTVNGCVGVDEHTAKLANIYPNPVADQLTIDVNASQVETINVVDALGRTIASYSNVSGIIQVNVSSYASGVYFVIAKNGTDYQSQRFVKK